MIRKVGIMNNDGKFPRSSGHWIEAETEGEILRIAHKLKQKGNRELINPRITICDNVFSDDYAPKKAVVIGEKTITLNKVKEDESGETRLKSFFRGKVWYEENGELQSIPIRERYRQLTEV